MRMQAVVMLKPLWQLFQRGSGIRQVSKGDVVSLKGFNKASRPFHWTADFQWAFSRA